MATKKSESILGSYKKFLDMKANQENAVPEEETNEFCPGRHRPEVPSFPEFYEQIIRRYKGQPQLAKILLVIHRYIESVYSGKPVHGERMLIAAPSSGGKTFLFEVIRNYLRTLNISLPIIILDATMYTETGFKGGEVSEMVDRILEAGFGSHAIVVLDEVDKRLRPSYGAKETNYNEAFQGCLLNMLGGGVCPGKVFDNNLRADETMFVLLGAFSDFRKSRRDDPEWVAQHPTSCRKHGIGFSVEDYDSEDGAEERDLSHFAPLSREDIIQYGSCEELVGRIGYVFNLQPLSNETVAELVQDYVTEISKEYGVPVRITPDAANDYVGISFGPTGLRHTRSELADLVNTAVAEHMISAPEVEVKEYRILGLNEIEAVPVRRRNGSPEGRVVSWGRG